jgi:predicted alpha/beta-fold hydrolase
MPLVPSSYNPPLLFKNGHISTVYYGLFRKIVGLQQERERLNLADGDFIDLDWSFSATPSNKVVILLHGLEGHGQRPYITGSAKYLNASGFDCCAVNFRGCSGETNRLFRSYHSGATEDLHAVVTHLLETKKYPEIFIKGISLGGNMSLKYAGEGRTLPKELKGIVAVSAPCDLYSSLKALLTLENTLYANRFKKHTSRAHGFKDAMDYYTQCSSLQFLENITIPSFILNAKNDSFLGPECYPTQQATKNSKVFLEMPAYGGHVGFYDVQNIAYSEKRALKFLSEI